MHGQFVLSVKKPVRQTQHHVYPRFDVSCYRPSLG
jgi:hypothetical protein